VTEGVERERNGEGISYPQPTRESGGGLYVKLPSGVRGGVGAENDFSAFSA